MPHAGAARERQLGNSVYLWLGACCVWFAEELGKAPCQLNISEVSYTAIRRMQGMLGCKEHQQLWFAVLMQAGPCCNNPIFAEIVPGHMRNMVYAFDRHAT